MTGNRRMCAGFYLEFLLIQLIWLPPNGRA